MSTISVCRICLGSDVSMYHMKNSEVQDVFEKLTCEKLTDNERPETICYLCYARLQKCNKILEIYKKTENLFAQLTTGGIEITHDAISFLKRSNISDLVTTPVNHLVIQPSKDLGDIIDQNMTIKEEPVQFKIESVDLSYECDMLEEVIYDYNSLELESYDISNTLNDEIIQKQLKFEVDDDEKKSDKRHRQNKTPCISKENIYTCLICSQRFDDKHDLKLHIKLHNTGKLYPCEECSEMFTIQGNLQRHIENIHKKSKLYTCEECAKSFTRSDHLKGHMRTHMGVKLYDCKICKMYFTTRSNVKQHVISIHSNERPYFCGICNKTFNRKRNWQEHDRIHTGEKPYSCNECVFKCSHWNTLRAHVTRMHLV